MGYLFREYGDEDTTVVIEIFSTYLQAVAMLVVKYEHRKL
jgi:hypothetical protein